MAMAVEPQIAVPKPINQINPIFLYIHCRRNVQSKTILPRAVLKTYESPMLVILPREIRIPINMTAHLGAVFGTEGNPSSTFIEQQVS